MRTRPTPTPVAGLAAIALAAISLLTPDAPAGQAPAGHDLVWAQEFNEPGEPDPAVWNHEEGFSRNEELQWYQRDNARIEDGLLVIEGRRERVKNPDYEPGSKNWRTKREHAEFTAASLTTRGTHAWKYGVFEMRARIDTRPGLWPAWWTLGSERPWPGCGEIDIMEYYRGKILANACWKKEGGRWAQHWDSVKVPLGEMGEGGDPDAWSNAFHVWRMEWTEDEIRLLCDGQLLNTIDVTATFNPDGSNPFREPHHMLVNLAIGGTQGGDPSQTDFPARYEIDYIRVYQTPDQQAARGETPQTNRNTDRARAHNADQPTRVTQPNLVLILADDLGYWDVGFHGCTDIPTPNIDRIAREGVRFTEAYVTGAVCGPSRAGLITGRYQDRFGCGNNPTVDPSVPNGVPTTERMISELLRPAGYESKAVGKWHLGTYPGLHPRDRGFDEFYGFLTGGHSYFPENLTLEDLSEVNQKWAWYRTKLLDNGKRVATTKYLTDELSDKAVEFIDRDRAHADSGADSERDQSPFFLYLCYNAPHTPMQATDEYLARFPDIEDTKRRTYAAMVSAMDDGIGRVLDALDRRGIADDTIVVFLSDNGGATNNASRNTPLRGHKSSPFEGGVRVPFALRWPGVAEPGTEFDEPISSLDIAATIVEAAGPAAKAQIRETHLLDGVDLAPYLTGRIEGPPHDRLCWTWFDRGESAIRLGDAKLIARPDDRGGDLLFDIEHDIGERRNLLRAGAESGHAITAGPLRDALDAWTSELIPPAHPSLGSWTFDDE